MKLHLHINRSPIRLEPPYPDTRAQKGGQRFMSSRMWRLRTVLTLNMHYSLIQDMHIRVE